MPAIDVYEIPNGGNPILAMNGEYEIPPTELLIDIDLTNKLSRSIDKNFSLNELDEILTPRIQELLNQKNFRISHFSSMFLR